MSKLTECKIISKVIDENIFYQLAKYNITQEDFVSLKNVYLFVQQYTKTEGSTPDYRTVVEEFEEFEYFPNVSDKVSYLAKKLKSYTITRLSYQMLQNEASKKFSSLNPNEFIEWLSDEVNHIKDVTNVVSCTGVDFGKNGKERWERYQERKEKRSNIFIKTPWNSLNDKMSGGMELGDYVLFTSFTNRGKSWVASQFALSAWQEGNGVLFYSPEMSHMQIEQRLDTLLGHFDNMLLRSGGLMNENKYEKYLQKFNESNTVPFIVKTFEDIQGGFTTDLIEADLQSNPNIKMIVIDGFSLLDHKSRDNNKINRFADTSIKLRQIFGRHQVLGLVIHQTNTSSEIRNKEEDDLGNRIIKCPDITDYADCSQLIKDCCTCFTYDANGNSAKIKVAKTRTNCLNFELDLYIDYNMGYINEVEECDYI